MYERIYGKRYDANLSRVEIAKLVRKTILEMKKEGTVNHNWKYSVTCGRGRGIDIRVQTVESPRTFDGIRDRYTKEVAGTYEILDELLESYNHDGSDIMSDHFDVKFYGNVSFSQMKEGQK